MEFWIELSTTMMSTKLKLSMKNTWLHLEYPRLTVRSQKVLPDLTISILGNRHVDEIARLALAFLRQMRIMREESSRFPEIYARMGIHSGNTVAGVIGSKMPRFCLFGETINLASRMETNGEPRRIQISATTKTLLDLTEASSYVTKARGPIHIKVFSVFLTGRRSRGPRNVVFLVLATLGSFQFFRFKVLSAIIAFIFRTFL